MYLVQEGVLFKCLTGILAVSTSWGAGSVLKYSNGLLSLLPMKRSQKFGGCDYKDNTTIMLNKLFSLCRKYTWKGTIKKLPSLIRKILKVIVGKLLAY